MRNCLLGLGEHWRNAARSCHFTRRRTRGLATQVMEDLIDDILLRDERDDPHRGGTVGTLERVDLYSEMAANAICRLLGEPIMFDP